MNTRTKLAVTIGAALLFPAVQASAGIDFNAGDWKIDISGNVNAFYVGADCDNGPAATTTVVGGLACTGNRSTAVRNGLLPAALVFSATTHQDDYDVGVTIGLYPGINSSAAAGANGPGLPAALQSPGIDARQAFFTVGQDWGTFKLGRDIGIFGKDAILDDMTLLGVGSVGNNAAPSNTSLGRIGLGYIYTDWEPQITYTTPNYGGFSGSIGVFQPLDAEGSALFTRHSSPQVQAGASYSFGDAKSDDLSGKVWVGGISQKVSASADDIVANGSSAAQSFTGTGFDAGVKLDVAGFEGVLYGYTGKGIGTTGLFILPTSADGEKRDSNGGYAQLSYKIGKLKIGASYGESRLKLASDEKAFSSSSDLLKRNSSGVGGIYYSLTKNVTLVGEYIDTKARAWNGNSAEETTYAIGGIVFF
ncbi:MAG TPA: porin [Rudaea sp.]|jgi:predicted porin|nr:porin [Rudaea sp.]